MSASMYGKDAAHMRQEMRHEEMYNQDPPTYNTTVKETQVQELDVIEIEPVECTPGMYLHPIGLLRIFELAYFFMLQWLVQITCGNDACTMIMNVFGYIALGQIFVLVIFLGLSIMCTLILVMTGLNGHRAFGKVIMALEKVYALLGIIFMIIAGALGTWMAVLTNDPEVNYQGRGRHHIKGQWIAAAVMEFLMVFLYIFDLWLQGRENYPFGIKDYQSDAYPTRLELEAGMTGPAMDSKTTKTVTTTTPTHQQDHTFQANRSFQQEKGFQQDFQALEYPPLPYTPRETQQPPAFSPYSQPPKNFNQSQF